MLYRLFYREGTASAEQQAATITAVDFSRWQ
jgi:hypothetical protein